MEAIGEVLGDTEQVLVTGRLDVQAIAIQARYPKVLAVAGPQACEVVVGAVHAHLPHALIGLLLL